MKTLRFFLCALLLLTLSSVTARAADGAVCTASPDALLSGIRVPLADFESGIPATSDSALLTVTGDAFSGASALSVLPMTDSGSCTLTVTPLTPPDVAGMRSFLTAVRLPEGDYSLTLRVLCEPDMPFDVPAVGCVSAVDFHADGGWQTVALPLEADAPLTRVVSLSLTFSYEEAPACLLLDDVGLTDLEDPVSVMRFLSTDYVFFGGSATRTEDGLLLTASEEDPTLELILAGGALDGHNAAEFRLTADESVASVRFSASASATGSFDAVGETVRAVQNGFNVLTFSVPSDAARIQLAFDMPAGGSVLLGSLTAADSGLAPSEGIGTVKSCTLTDARRVRVTGTLKSGAAAQYRGLRIGVYELRAGESRDVIRSGAVEPITTVRASGSFTADFSLNDGARSRLTSAFVCGVLLDDGGVALLDGGRCVSNPGLLAGGGWNYPEIRSKKGCAGDGLSAADAVLLGVRNTVLDVTLTDLFGSGLTYTYNGIEYSFDSAKVDALDRKVSALTAASSLVRLRLLPGTLRSGGVCPYLTDAASLGTYAAAVSFLSSRYSGGSREHGRVVAYLLDSPRAESGVRCDPVAAAAETAVVLRLTHTLVASQGSAKTLVACGCGWETADGLNSRAFLETLARITDASGAFDWGVAFDPTPSTGAVYASWNDAEALPDGSARRVTAANLTVLTSFLSRSEMLFDGHLRTLLLYDPDAAQPSMPTEASVAAAEYALTYCRVNTRQMAGIECYIVSAAPDYEDLFAGIDTGRTAEVCAFALPVIGASDWKELVSGYDETLLARRTVMTADSREDGTEYAAQVPLYGGGAFLNRLSAAEGGVLLAAELLPEGALESFAFTGGADSVLLSAAAAYPIDLTAAPRLQFSMLLTGTGGSTPVSLTLHLCSGDSRLEVPLTIIAGSWRHFTVDVSAFATGARRIDRVRLTASGVPEGATLSLAEISAVSDTMTQSELTAAFAAQMKSGRASGFADRRMVRALLGVILLAALLLLVRRLPRRRGEPEGADFTDMRNWR